MESQPPPSHQHVPHPPPTYPPTQHLPPPSQHAPQIPHHLAHVVNPSYAIATQSSHPHPMAVSAIPISVPVPVTHPNHHHHHHPVHSQPNTSTSIDHVSIASSSSLQLQTPQSHESQSIHHTTSAHLPSHLSSHPNHHHTTHNHHPLPSMQPHPPPHQHHQHHQSLAPPPSPYSSYYDSFPTAKIAQLEAELEKARVEIDRLRIKLSEYEKERSKTDPPKLQSRYWTPSEHKRFLEALQKFGAKDVRAIANFVGSRNATQVRTHAQKYFLRIAREAKAGNALQATRKRSMSESDLARVGRSIKTPPGSPTIRENKPPPPLPPPISSDNPIGCSSSSQMDTTMTPVSLDIPTGPHTALPPTPSSMPINLQDTVIQQQQQSQQSQQTNLLSLSKPPTFGSTCQHISTSKEDVTMMSTSKPSPPPSVSGVTAGKPPVASSKLSDTTGMNLLSLVASEHKMETERVAPR